MVQFLNRVVQLSFRSLVVVNLYFDFGTPDDSSPLLSV